MSNTPIFREYIGVKSFPNLGDFPDIVGNVEQFHFILGIGTESYTTDGKGLGNFTCTWDQQIFNGERVLAIKKKYPTRVKVILSFGGVGTDELSFNPKNKNIWYTTAYNNIKAIITQYQTMDPDTNTMINTIDGIDINYEYIKTDNTVFTECIGNLISNLRNDSDLSLRIFSISPSERVQSHYQSLYSRYPNTISWINYQFYLQPVSTMDDFVNLYRASVYPQSKLLPGVSTDSRTAGNLIPNNFIAGITKLHRENVLAGAFVWNANDSNAPPPGENRFYLENTIQQILTSRNE